MAMISSRQFAGSGVPVVVLVAAVVISGLLSEGRAYAQAGGDSVASPTRAPANIRRSLAAVDFGAGVAQTGQRPGPMIKASPVAGKVTRAVLGAVGGFAIGGFFGAKIEGDRCQCGDRGLKGGVIGAHIGAVAGGILGARFF